MNNRALTADEALNKAEKYCAYQERCTSQVVNYLKRTSITSPQILDVIAKLKENGFIDDERFARA
jgi:regulatory protein